MKWNSPRLTPWLSFWLLTAAALSASAIAADPVDPSSASPNSGGRTDVPEEDDFQDTAYTRYGEFDDGDEDEDLKYMQYGRFFGVSLGVGYEGAMGNKGSLYNGGFPAVSVNLLYWFDFNFALAFGVLTSSHSFNGALQSRNDTSIKAYDLNLFRFGVDLRYYFDTRDAAAPISFANPFLSAGVASYTRTLQNTQSETDKDTEGSIGFNAGVGLEFVLKPKKAYFNLETKAHQVKFSETNSPVGLNGGIGNDPYAGTGNLSDQKGLLYTVIGSFLFTW